MDRLNQSGRFRPKFTPRAGVEGQIGTAANAGNSSLLRACSISAAKMDGMSKRCHVSTRLLSAAESIPGSSPSAGLPGWCFPEGPSDRSDNAFLAVERAPRHISGITDTSSSARTPADCQAERRPFLFSSRGGIASRRPPRPGSRSQKLNARRFRP